VSPVRYELDFYIPEDGILHSHRRENLKSYNKNLDWKTSNLCSERDHDNSNEGNSCLAECELDFNVLGKGP
jgi:hypothetical protein